MGSLSHLILVFSLRSLSTFFLCSIKGVFVAFVRIALACIYLYVIQRR